LFEEKEKMIQFKIILNLKMNIFNLAFLMKKDKKQNFKKH